MYKILSFFVICFTLFIAACSSPVKQHQEFVPTSTEPVAEHKKHSRHPLPNGTTSVDIVKHQDKLHLLTGTHQEGVKALWYQNSADQGKSWSEPVNINASKHIKANLTRGNDARLAVQGNKLVAIWASRVKGAPHNAGSMQAARSADGGKTWQTTLIPADWTSGSHAFFAMDANNHSINAIWLDSRDGRSSVKGSQGMRYSQSLDGGQSWSSNKTLDSMTCACCWNTAKFDSKNNFYVLYRDKQPSDMAIGVLNETQHWQRLSSVGTFNWDFPGCPHIGGGLAFQDNEKFIHSVIGSGHINHLGIHYLRSSDHGNSWTTPLQLGDESAIHSDIAAHENGRVIAVWDMRTEDGLSVFYAESTNQGINWSQFNRLSKPGMRATHPRIISNKNGFLVLWTESQTGKTQALQMQLL